MRFIQFAEPGGSRRVAAIVDQGDPLLLSGTERLYDLALEAGREGKPLEEIARARLSAERVDYDRLIAGKRLLPPLDHPDPAHCLVSGTGLTHLGSAQARNAMHAGAAAGEPLTDSMRLFRLGLEGGKPGEGRISVQPEWFYKGSGYNLAAPEQDLVSPGFALDGGEEAELVGLYVISETGEPLRVGFALGNEFSDHVMEAQNYLYLAHSKLRPCSVGPELVPGLAPARVAGTVRILRAGQALWEAPFHSGEENMAYTVASLEHHHFKYDFFRQPGDVHIHFFGAAVLSKNAGIAAQTGDCFEIEADGFGRPLRNPLRQAPANERTPGVRVL